MEDGKGREAALQGQVEAEQAKLADAEGQRGEVGEEVARVRGELEACRAELEEAQKGLQDAEASHEDTKALLKGSQDETESRQKELDDLKTSSAENTTAAASQHDELTQGMIRDCHSLNTFRHCLASGVYPLSPHRPNF